MRVNYTVLHNLMNIRTADRGVFEHPSPDPFRLSEMLKEVCPFSDQELRVSVNSELLLPGEVDQWNVRDGDHVLVVPSIGYEGAAIAIALIGLAFAIGFSIYSYLEMKKSIDNLKDMMEGVEGGLEDSQASLSQAFGFNVKENILKDGNPIPVLYGKFRLGGTIINQFVFSHSHGETEGTRIQLALGEGPMTAVAPNGSDDVYLNDTKLSSFSNWVMQTSVGPSDFGDETYDHANEIFLRIYQQKFHDDDLIHYNTLHFRFSGNKAYMFRGLTRGHQTPSMPVDTNNITSVTEAGITQAIRLNATDSYAALRDLSNSEDAGIQELCDPYMDPVTVSWYMKDYNIAGLANDNEYIIFGSGPEQMWGTTHWGVEWPDPPEPDDPDPDDDYDFTMQRTWSVMMRKYSSGKIRLKFEIMKRGNENSGYNEKLTIVWSQQFHPNNFGEHGSGWSAFAFVREGDMFKFFMDGRDITDHTEDEIGNDSSIHAEGWRWKETGEIDSYDTFFSIGKGIRSGFMNQGAMVIIGELKMYLGIAKWYGLYNPGSTEVEEEMQDLEQPVDHTTEMEGKAHGIIIQYRFPEGLYGSGWRHDPERWGMTVRESASCANWGAVYNHPSTANYPFDNTNLYNCRTMWGQASGPVGRSVEIPFRYIDVLTIPSPPKADEDPLDPWYDKPWQMGEVIRLYQGWGSQYGGMGGYLSAIILGWSHGASGWRLYIGCETLENIDSFMWNLEVGDEIEGMSSGAWGQVTMAVQEGFLHPTWRVRVLNPTRGCQRRRNHMQLRATTRYLNRSPAYQGTAWVAIEIKAGRRVAQVPKINVICERTENTETPLTRWNGSAYVTITGTTVSFTNPAWIVWDVLTNGWYKPDGTRMGYYGAGIDPKQLDYDSFLEWAAYCHYSVNSIPRCKANMIYDVKKKTVWDAIEMAAIVGRGRIKMIGNKYYASFTEPSSSDPDDITPVQIFTSGNIKEGSMKTTWMEPESKPDRVVIEFSNEDADYLKDEVQADVNEWDEATEAANMVSYFIPGITKRDHARREAIFRLQIARSTKKRIEFDTDVDAVACEIGDVIAVQHEMHYYTHGGRVISSTGTTITLDREITLNSSIFDDNCVIWVRRGTSMRKRNITGPFDEETDTFNVESNTGGVEGDPYGIGRAEDEIWLYMIEEVEISEEATVKIVALNFDPSAYFHADYNDGATVI